MTTLPNPPERHIDTPHPYTQFYNICKDTITPPNTIHKKLYDYIHLNSNILSIQNLMKAFPYLPRQLRIEALGYNQPIDENTHPDLPSPPPPDTKLTPPNESLPLTSLESCAFAWNASSLNTAMPYLQDLIQTHKTHHQLSPYKKLSYPPPNPPTISNDCFHTTNFFLTTHIITRGTRQRMTYRGYRGGLLLLIHKKHAFPGNLTKVPTPAEMSTFLQIIRIANQPLQPWLLLNLYMPSHEEDIPLIPIIQHTITYQVNLHPNHTYILCGDFIRDIALIGRQNDQQTTPLQPKDHLWRSFTTSLELSYVPTNTKFSRQGCHNYTQNSLMDGFFIKTPNNNQYTSTTNQDTQLNSDHLPIHLQIPPNTLIAKDPAITSEPPPRILNPISQEKIDEFHNFLSERHSNQIDDLTTFYKITN